MEIFGSFLSKFCKPCATYSRQYRIFNVLCAEIGKLLSKLSAYIVAARIAFLAFVLQKMQIDYFIAHDRSDAPRSPGPSPT